jgi:hypothetical protein
MSLQWLSKHLTWFQLTSLHAPLFHRGRILIKSRPNSADEHPILSSKDLLNSILTCNPLSVRRPLVHTQHLRVTTINTTSIDLLLRILHSFCSPQVHPPRTTPSKKLRDTYRLNSTKAWGFHNSTYWSLTPCISSGRHKPVSRHLPC